MSLRQPKKPRFWCDLGLFNYYVGHSLPKFYDGGFDDNKALSLMGFNFAEKVSVHNEEWMNLYYTQRTAPIKYIMMFNAKGIGAISPGWSNDLNNIDTAEISSTTDIHGNTDLDDGQALYIRTFDDNDYKYLSIFTAYSGQLGADKIGAFSVGDYYTMVEPNVNVELIRQYDKSNDYITISGASGSNTMWTRPPMLEHPLTDRLHMPTRTGRRIWRLTWSHLDRGDLYGPNQSLSFYEWVLNTQAQAENYDVGDMSFGTGSPTVTLKPGWNPENQAFCILYPKSSLVGQTGFYLANNIPGVKSIVKSQDCVNYHGSLAIPEGGGAVYGTDYTIQSGDTFIIEMWGSASEHVTSLLYSTEDSEDGGGWLQGFNYNVLTDDNFFSKVWLRTLGGSIPMVFQENSEDNNIDSFTVVRIQSNSLRIRRQSIKTYEISLIIEETW